jgi:hypothetical protein
MTDLELALQAVSKAQRIIEENTLSRGRMTMNASTGCGVSTKTT